MITKRDVWVMYDRLFSTSERPFKVSLGSWCLPSNIDKTYGRTEHFVFIAKDTFARYISTRTWFQVEEIVDFLKSRGALVEVTLMSVIQNHPVKQETLEKIKQAGIESVSCYRILLKKLDKLRGGAYIIGIKYKPPLCRFVEFIDALVECKLREITIFTDKKEYRKVVKDKVYKNNRVFIDRGDDGDYLYISRKVFKRYIFYDKTEFKKLEEKLSDLGVFPEGYSYYHNDCQKYMVNFCGEPHYEILLDKFDERSYRNVYPLYNEIIMARRRNEPPVTDRQMAKKIRKILNNLKKRKVYYGN